MRFAPPMPARSATAPPVAAAPSTLPFDYTAVFTLRGAPGNIVQDVISISGESDFVALGISYGFQPSSGPIVTLVNAPSPNLGLSLRNIPLDAWIQGIRLNPRLLPRTLTSDVPPALDTSAPSAQAFVSSVSTQVRFLFTAIDTTSGRELHDQPVNNLASLGESTGRRPFRHFPQPFVLSRNSTIRLQITEESVGTAGDLFIVLFGYKANFEPCARPQVTSGAGSRVVPFDYVARLPLSGVRGRRVEREVILDTSGGFRVTSLGYAVNSSDEVPVTRDLIDPTVGLGNLSILALPASAWLDGVRLRPGVFRDVVVNGAALTDADLPEPILQRVFQRLNRPEDTFFRYEISDGGTGRELQNRPILNIAGLGSADGRRPFKQFAQPLEFGPRSTIKVAVEEGSGSGDLFLVFQGFRNDGRLGGRR
jgi:hypothetical protein